MARIAPAASAPHAFQPAEKVVPPAFVVFRFLKTLPLAHPYIH
jgi:hypothetical protein